MDLNLRKSYEGVMRGDCPACGYKDSFTVRRGENGKPLFWCSSCRDQESLLKVMRGVALDNLPQAAAHKPARKDKREAALAIWRRGVDATRTLAHSYLRKRGIDIPPPPTLRFVGRSKHLPSETWWPMMVGAVSVWPNRHIVAIHRTYISRQGKAPVDPVKKTLGPIEGGAVRLAPHAPVLIVGEGIETCFSVMQVTGLPAWAALSAGNLTRIVLPPVSEVRHVMIAADNDEKGIGLAAAEEAAKRFEGEGRQVSVHMPNQVGADFNDILQAAE
jgi:phage/plasmid primase-like uncharacterized protein